MSWLNRREETLDVLEAWCEEGWIRPLDLSFARLLDELCREQGEAPSPLLLLLASLCSHQVGRGHVCLELEAVLAEPGQTLALPPEHAPAADLLPAPADWLSGIDVDRCRQVLAGSIAVSDGDALAPLVFTGGRLYLRRYWRYEQQVAAAVAGRLQRQNPLDDAESPAARGLARALDVLFSEGPEPDYQKAACALAARKPFGVITGGPGTGKTTTVVKLLAALQSAALATGGRKQRICLAAPTGKAAARLNESIAAALGQLPLADLPGAPSPEDIPRQVSTLHRLLGARPGSRRFRHDADNPLWLDILVVDEASMVDLDLMASVFQALPAHTQVILLGDKDQLASVDAGAVLGELCRGANQGLYHPDTLRWLRAVSGQQLPPDLQDENGSALDQAVALLRRSWRFQEGSGIGRLADAVNRNDLDQNLLRQCRERGYDDLAWLVPDGGENQALRQLAGHALSGGADAFANRGRDRRIGDRTVAPPAGYRHYLTLLRDHPLNAQSSRAQWDRLGARMLEAFADFQVLCPLRHGPWGVEGLNELIAQQLQRAGLIPRSEGWYAGRPVLITGNDYNLGLMNGDVGITMEVPWDRDAQGQPQQTLRVVFPDGAGGVRWISPSRLQSLETVYAMTVHKSQGSEFTHGCLVLPDRLSPVITRELVYTGITRARYWFSLFLPRESLLQQAVAQQVRRASGVRDAIAVASR